jgi:hypothetical protein
MSRVNFMNLKAKLWRQIIILGLAILAIGLTFVFVVFPLLVRITGERNTARNLIIERQFPPQAPVFNAMDGFVNHPELTVSGFAKQGTRLHIVLNGQDLDSVLVGSDGRFQTRLRLEEGENVFYAYVIDEDGLESSYSSSNTVVLDMTDPFLIFDPELEHRVVGRNNRNLIVTGETEPGSRVYVNDVLGSVDENGYFTLTHYLSDGYNTLNIEAVDRAGNSEQATLEIYFTP